MSHPLAMMGTMFQPNGSSIECGTCVAANTSACSDCIVNYVLANDAGPVDFVPVQVGRHDHDERVDGVVRMFVTAGLVDDPALEQDRAQSNVIHARRLCLRTLHRRAGTAILSAPPDSVLQALLRRDGEFRRELASGEPAARLDQLPAVARVA